MVDIYDNNVNPEEGMDLATSTMSRAGDTRLGWKGAMTSTGQGHGHPALSQDTRPVCTTILSRETWSYSQLYILKSYFVPYCSSVPILEN